MATLGRFRRLLVYIGLFSVGLLFLVVAVSVPYWETGPDAAHRGLWQSCYDQCHVWRSNELMSLVNHELPLISYTIAQTLMSSGLVLTILALATYTSWITQHKDHRLMLLTCILTITSALAVVGGVLAFALMRPTDAESGYVLSWGFWLAAVAAVLLFITSLVLILDRGIMTKLEHDRISDPIYGSSPSKTNPAFLDSGSTYGFNRNSGVSTVAHAPLYSRPSSYLLPEGLHQGARGASVGSMEDDTRQPWAAGSGQLF